MASATESSRPKTVRLVTSQPSRNSGVDSLAASRAGNETTHSSSSHHVIDSNTGKSQFAFSGDALHGKPTKAPKRPVSSNLFLDDKLQRISSKTSSLMSEPTRLNSESSKVTATKCNSSESTNKQTKQSLMSSSISSYPTTADDVIGTSTAENKPSGKPTKKPFRTNKKSSRRAVSKITRQSPPSLVNTVDTSPIKTSLKIESPKLQVPEYSVGAVSTSKESTSLNGNFVLSGLTQNLNECDLHDKHRYKTSDGISFPKRSSRPLGGNAQSQANPFPKDHKNNSAFFNKHSNTVSKSHAIHSTRNLGSPSMGRTDKSNNDYSENASHNGNDSPSIHSLRTSQSFRSSNNNFTLNEGHSPKALCAFSRESDKEHPSHTRHSPVYSGSSFTTNYARESKFRHSPRGPRFERKLNNEHSLKETSGFISHTKYSQRNLSSHTDSVRKVESHRRHDNSQKVSGDAVDRYSARAHYSPRDSEGIAHYGYEPWFHNSRISRVDLTPNSRRYPNASNSAQCHAAYSPKNIYYHTGSGESADSYQSQTALEDVFLDIGCSLTTLHSHASKSDESHEERCLSPNAVDAYSPRERLAKALNSPIGSGRRAKFYKGHPRTSVFQNTSSVSDNVQSTKTFKASKPNDLDKSFAGDLSGSLGKSCESSTENSSANLDGTDVKPRSKNIKSFINFPPIWSRIKLSDIRHISSSNLPKKDENLVWDFSNPEASLNYLEGNISSSNKPQETENCKFLKYVILSSTDISHAQINNNHHPAAISEGLFPELNDRFQHASSLHNIRKLDALAEVPRTLNAPEIRPNELYVPEKPPNEPHVPQNRPNDPLTPQNQPNDPHVPQNWPNQPHVPQKWPNTLHVPQSHPNMLNVHQPWPHESYFPLHLQDGLYVSQVWPCRLMFLKQRLNDSYSSLMNEPSASLPSLDKQPISIPSLNEPPVSQPSLSEPTVSQPFSEEPHVQLYQYGYSTIAHIHQIWQSRPYVPQLLPPAKSYDPQLPPPARPYVPQLPPLPYDPQQPPPFRPYLPHLPPPSRPYLPQLPPPSRPYVPQLPPPSRPHVFEMQANRLQFPEQWLKKVYGQQSLNEPPYYQPHQDEQPAYQLHQDESPAYHPHLDEPPTYHPHLDEPPAYHPHLDEPPAYHPHLDGPHAYHPHLDEPPVYHPHLDEPPIYHPHLDEPHAYQPYLDELPVHQPSPTETPVVN